MVDLLKVWSLVLIASLLLAKSKYVIGQINREALRNQKQVDSGKYRKFEAMQLNLRNQKKKLKEKQGKAARLDLQYSMNGTRFCEKSLQFPDEFLSVSSYKGGVVPISEAERRGSLKCTFLGAVCPTEAAEHSLVNSYLNQNDTVLEVYKISYASKTIMLFLSYCLCYHDTGWSKVWHHIVRYR